MSQIIAGGCYCRAIRFECSADPIISFLCHCLDCQRVTGGGPYPAILVPSTGMWFTNGQPKYNQFPSVAGESKHYGFCPDCGNPVDAKIEGRPDIWFLAVGAFDVPSMFTPTMELFTSRAKPWTTLSPNLHNFPEGPSM